MTREAGHSSSCSHPVCVPPSGQDEALAERMLEKVDSFIREARQGGNSNSSSFPSHGHGAGAGGAGTQGAAEQAPLELEVHYDDSWLDEMACGLFLVIALALMTRPYVEVRLKPIDDHSVACNAQQQQIEGFLTPPAFCPRRHPSRSKR